VMLVTVISRLIVVHPAFIYKKNHENWLADHRDQRNQPGGRSLNYLRAFGGGLFVYQLNPQAKAFSPQGNLGTFGFACCDCLTS